VDSNDATEAVSPWKLAALDQAVDRLAVDSEQFGDLVCGENVWPGLVSAFSVSGARQIGVGKGRLLRLRDRTFSSTTIGDSAVGL
jgi:hypothetical protein